MRMFIYMYCPCFKWINLKSELFVRQKYHKALVQLNLETLSNIETQKEKDQQKSSTCVQLQVLSEKTTHEK